MLVSLLRCWCISGLRVGWLMVKKKIDVDKAVSAIVGSMVALVLLDELIRQLRLRGLFREFDEYRLFNCRM